MHGYQYPDPKQIDGTILRIFNIQTPEPFEYDSTEEVVFTKQERTKYRTFIGQAGERAKSKRKARTVGEKGAARCKASRTARKRV